MLWREAFAYERFDLTEPVFESGLETIGNAIIGVRQGQSAAPRSGPLMYRLASSVPPCWLPLIPEHAGSNKREVVFAPSRTTVGSDCVHHQSIIDGE